jgi:hypothetical protein
MTFACVDCAVVSERKRCPRCEAKHNASRNRRATERQDDRTRGAAGVKLRAEVRERFGNRCAALIDDKRCPVSTELEIHHIDGDRTNDAAINLVPLCHQCHLQLQELGDVGFAMPEHRKRPKPLFA